VAETTGFIDAAREAPFEVLPDYTVPFLGETGLSTIIAGVIGVLLVAGLIVLVARVLRGRRT
jgi:cobalt/nickel transport system permease protein